MIGPTTLLKTGSLNTEHVTIIIVRWKSNEEREGEGEKMEAEREKMERRGENVFQGRRQKDKEREEDVFKSIK